MKTQTWGLIIIVVALHSAVIGSLFLISGCKSTPRTVTTPAVEPAMPSPYQPKTQPAPQPEPQLPARSMQPKLSQPAMPVGGGEYTVQAGDSLSVIARRCGVSQAELIEANNIKDPNKIRIGQKLILPPTGKLPAVVSKKAEPSQPAVKPVAAGGEYIVKSGDCLSKIAAQHGVKLRALREANKLTGDKVLPGQKLIIPSGASDKPAPVKAATPPVAVEQPAPASAPAPAQVDTLFEPMEHETLESNEEVVLPVVTAKPEVAVLPVSTGTGAIIHQVKPDETLEEIAKNYVTSVEELREINQLSADNAIYPGQRLRIP